MKVLAFTVALCVVRIKYKNQKADKRLKIDSHYKSQIYCLATWTFETDIAKVLDWLDDDAHAWHVILMHIDDLAIYVTLRLAGTSVAMKNQWCFDLFWIKEMCFWTQAWWKQAW